MFLLEKQHIRKVSSPLSTLESNHTESITRNVNKDNTVRYASNRYSLPLGTYTKYSEVCLILEGNVLKIIVPLTGELLAEHTISLEKGKLIKNRNHQRDRSTSLNELQQNVLTLFPYEEAEPYIQQVCDTYGRYRRDQLLLFQKVATESPEWISVALEKCIKEKLYSANEFRDVVQHLKQIKETAITKPIIRLKDQPSITIPVQTRDLKAYVDLMGGK